MSNYEAIHKLEQSVSTQIIGQEKLINRMLIAILANGHLLVEGAPGLAKTTAIKTLANGIEADFHRIQFTPDLLPADLTGTDVYRPEDGTFVFQQGPVFHNLLLADEINRAPAKVQSALLEAMGEHQITIGRKTYPLPELFMVMATQNPIEQEGTYPLPEAQLDRFLMHIDVSYPDAEAEKKILHYVRARDRGESQETSNENWRISQSTIFAARKELASVYMSDEVEQYIIQLITATRNPAAYNNELSRWINYGASPRATIALDICSRAHAWLKKQDYVTPENVQEVAFDILRHRLLLTYEAEAEGLHPNEIIQQLISVVAVP